MNNQRSSILIALAGGSGAGKTWLVNSLLEVFGDEATSLSLDDFYRDFSHLPLAERSRINFDHPDTIDWPLFENALRKLRNGETTLVPRYDYVSHTRWNNGEWRCPRSIIFVEGLWLLAYEHVRELFHLRIFLDCPEALRRQRRLARDIKERGRTEDSIAEQIRNFVAPMHERFVEPQKRWADLILGQPISPVKRDHLVAKICTLRAASDSVPLELLGSRAALSAFSSPQYL